MTQKIPTAQIKPILQKIDTLQIKINRLRPLKPEMMTTIQEKLRIEWTYNSNAIEGNTLTLGETMFFLREGLTSEGKLLHDYLEAKNHAQAIDGLYEIIHGERDLSENLIKQLHGVLMNEFHGGRYKLQPNHVLTLLGKIHHYTEPVKVHDEMENLLSWYHKKDPMHIVEKTAIFHYRFVAIHPFDDGNGRMARLLMNLILMKHGYPPCIIRNIHRKKYLEALSHADNEKDYIPFITLVAQELSYTQETMVDILIGTNSATNHNAMESTLSPSLPLHESERKSRILELFQKHSTLSIGQILYLLPIMKRPTLKTDLKHLVTSGAIRKKGVGKGVVYSLTT